MVVIISFVCSACSHTLDIKNMGTYRTLGVVYEEDPVCIGVITNTTQPVEGGYVRTICESLQNTGCATRVLFPYNFSLHKRNPKADIIVKINLSTDYSGSGWNFLINWPGFLIFTPAWNGYIYNADMDFQISIIDGKTNKSIDNFTVPIKYDIRHADMNRTWTVGVGWFEWGITPLIGGFFFTNYDDTITELILYKTRKNVGDYVSEKIALRLRNYMPIIHE